jgi:rhodanese-related sulfurtransferase
VQPAELAKGAVDGAVNFPLSSLREKLHELPQDKKLYVYCQVRCTLVCTAAVKYLLCRPVEQIVHVQPGEAGVSHTMLLCNTYTTYTAHMWMPHPHCSLTTLALQVGLRGYNATRQLLLAGLDAVNVSGGYRSWLQAKL